MLFFSFVGDSIWTLRAYDPTSSEQHNYAGLLSTVLILFHYLQYDVQFNIRHPKFYIVYQFVILLAILAGDAVYAYYYRTKKGNVFMMVMFIFYAVIDVSYVILVGLLKYRDYRSTMNISIHTLFHLMSRLEVLLFIMIPIFSSYDVNSTNSIAFFILYEFFSESYINHDLKYSRLSRLSFWLLIILATISVICENIEFAYSRRAENEHNPSTKEYYHKIANGMEYTNHISDFLATLSCYSLLLLQFFSISDEKRRKQKQTFAA